MKALVARARLEGGVAARSLISPTESRRGLQLTIDNVCIGNFKISPCCNSAWVGSIVFSTVINKIMLHEAAGRHAESHCGDRQTSRGAWGSVSMLPTLKP